MNEVLQNGTAKRVAVIDIGSNSIRYMEAQYSDNRTTFSQKAVYTTRLAEGLAATGNLSEDRMQQSLAVLSSLVRNAKSEGFTPFAYATSAVRDASNRSVFLKHVLHQTGLQVHILSGNEEAAFAYLGATGNTGGMIDIGGGSTQVITQSYRKSFPIGCVRVKDICGDRPYPEMQTALQARFKTTFALPCLDETQWFAVGGTATTLAALHLRLSRYAPESINRCTMTALEIHAALDQLDAMGTKARRAHPLLLERHDVILCGGAILSYLIEHLGIERIAFKDADGMEGYCIGYLFS